MSRGATARLFVAVDPPPEVCAELAAWAREALGGLHAGAAESDETSGTPAPGAVRLLRPETMHVTMCFLGARPIGEVDAIAAALSACAAPRLRLRVGAPLWLPPRRPRSLALEVGDRAGELARLAVCVRDALAAQIDWQPERRRFRGHVTVARIGRGRERARRLRASRRGDGGHASPAAAALPLSPTPQLSFDVAELVLYRSLLSREGASYEALARRDLRASDELPAWPAPSSSSGVGSGEGSEPTGHASSGSSSTDEPSSSHSRSEPPSQE